MTTFVKGNVRIEFIRALAPTDRVRDAQQRPAGVQPVRGPHTSAMDSARYVGRSTGSKTQRSLQCISEANLKHGRQTKDKLAAQRHLADVELWAS